jgi:hypothetical protein
MTVRPWWRDGQLIDLPGALVSVGEEAGLVLYERDCIAAQPGPRPSGRSPVPEEAQATSRSRRVPLRWTASVSTCTSSDNSTLLDEWIIPASYRFLDHSSGNKLRMILIPIL